VREIAEPPIIGGFIPFLEMGVRRNSADIPTVGPRSKRTMMEEVVPKMARRRGSDAEQSWRR